MIIELLKRQKKDKNIAFFWRYNFDRKVGEHYSNREGKYKGIAFL